MTVGFLAKCGRKKRHETQAAAERDRERLIAAGIWTRVKSNTYGCNACGGFHAGSTGAGNRGKGRRIKTRPVHHVQ